MTHNQYKKFLVILKKINKLEIKIRREEFEVYFKQLGVKVCKFVLATYGSFEANRFGWEVCGVEGSCIRRYTFFKQSFIALQKLKTHNKLRAKRGKKSKLKLSSLDG